MPGFYDHRYFFTEIGYNLKLTEIHSAIGLAQLEQLGLLAAVFTQNIDNLHQEAGSRTVIEFHGNGRRLTCLSCGATVGHEEAAKNVDD